MAGSEILELNGGFNGTIICKCFFQHSHVWLPRGNQHNMERTKLWPEKNGFPVWRVCTPSHSLCSSRGLYNTEDGHIHQRKQARKAIVISNYQFVHHLKMKLYGGFQQVMGVPPVMVPPSDFRIHSTSSSDKGDPPWSPMTMESHHDPHRFPHLRPERCSWTGKHPWIVSPRSQRCKHGGTSQKHWVKTIKGYVENWVI